MICKRVAQILLLIVLSIFPVFSQVYAYSDTEIIGTVPEILYSNSGNGSLSDESALGDVCADAAVYAVDADIGIICGGDLAGNLLPSDVSYSDINFVFSESQSLVIAELSPAELRALLEFCMSHLTVDLKTLKIDRQISEFDGFPQISGMKIRYDVSDYEGERVQSISLLSGEELMLGDNAGKLTLVTTEALLCGAYGQTGIDIDYMQTSFDEAKALAIFISDGMLDDYSAEKRIEIIGSSDNTIFNTLGINGAAIVLALILVILGIKCTTAKVSDYKNSPIMKEFDK